MNHPKNVVAFNEEVFKRLYNSNYSILLGQLQRKGINKFDAEDLIQEAFLILWRIRNSTRIEIKNPDSYIKGIINNLTYRFFKEKKKFISFEESEIDGLFNEKIINIDEEILERLERIDKENNIKNALSELEKEGKMNERKEDIFNKFYHEDKSYFEISKELEASINEIGVTLFRLRNEIRKKILEKKEALNNGS
jgi:RNA polymerase sigma factor (sigma-70 family)